jgi:hypothetical protein
LSQRFATGALSFSQLKNTRQNIFYSVFLYDYIEIQKAKLMNIDRTNSFASENTKLHVHDLKKEPILEILKKLELPDLQSIAHTCRYFRNLIKKTRVLLGKQTSYQAICLFQKAAQSIRSTNNLENIEKIDCWGASMYSYARFVDFNFFLKAMKQPGLVINSMLKINELLFVGTSLITSIPEKKIRSQRGKETLDLASIFLRELDVNLVSTTQLTYFNEKIFLSNIMLQGFAKVMEHYNYKLNDSKAKKDFLLEIIWYHFNNFPDLIENIAKWAIHSTSITTKDRVDILIKIASKLRYFDSEKSQNIFSQSIRLYQDEMAFYHDLNKTLELHNTLRDFLYILKLGAHIDPELALKKLNQIEETIDKNQFYSEILMTRINIAKAFAVKKYPKKALRILQVYEKPPDDDYLNTKLNSAKLKVIQKLPPKKALRILDLLQEQFNKSLRKESNKVKREIGKRFIDEGKFEQVLSIAESCNPEDYQILMVEMIRNLAITDFDEALKVVESEPIIKDYLKREMAIAISIDDLEMSLKITSELNYYHKCHALKGILIKVAETDLYKALDLIIELDLITFFNASETDPPVKLDEILAELAPFSKSLDVVEMIDDKKIQYQGFKNQIKKLAYTDPEAALECVFAHHCDPMIKAWGYRKIAIATSFKMIKLNKNSPK